MIFSDKEIHKELLNDLYQEIMWRFDMNMDLERFNSMAQKDALLGPVVTRRLGMRIMTNHSLYEFLIVSFVLQNATIKRTVQMMENLISAYGYKLEFDTKVISCFWNPSRLSSVDENELKELKVGYRAKFIKRLSEDFYKYELDENKLRLYKSEDLRKELLRLYGVGKQSVWYIMFEVFHRYDVLETISPWEQKVYSRIIYNKELVNVEKIIKRASRTWGKWRMFAMHYLFEDLFWRRKDGDELWLDNYLNY